MHDMQRGKNALCDQLSIDSQTKMKYKTIVKKCVVDSMRGSTGGSLDLGSTVFWIKKNNKLLRKVLSKCCENLSLWYFYFSAIIALFLKIPCNVNRKLRLHLLITYQSLG